MSPGVDIIALEMLVMSRLRPCRSPGEMLRTLHDTAQEIMQLKLNAVGGLSFRFIDGFDRSSGRPDMESDGRLVRRPHRLQDHPVHAGESGAGNC